MDHPHWPTKAQIRCGRPNLTCFFTCIVCISKDSVVQRQLHSFAMSGSAVQINNASSGTVYITDDAAVEASMLDWLHRQEDASANTIHEPPAPMSLAQPQGTNKGTSKGKGEMESGHPTDGQNQPINADGASDRAKPRSRSPLRARAKSQTQTSSTAATAATAFQ